MARTMKPMRVSAPIAPPAPRVGVAPSVPDELEAGVDTEEEAPTASAGSAEFPHEIGPETEAIRSEGVAGVPIEPEYSDDPLSEHTAAEVEEGRRATHSFAHRHQAELDAGRKAIAGKSPRRPT